MTIPVFPVPNVQPMYFSQGNPGQESIQKALQTLVALKQSQAEQAFTQAQATQKMQTDNQAGQLVAGFLANIGTQQVPGLPTAAGPTQPFTVKNPALTSFQDAMKTGTPGRAVLAATNAASGAISSEVGRINEERKRQKALPGTPYTVTQTDSDGFWVGIRRDTGKAEQILDASGKPIQLRAKNQPSQRFVKMLNKDGTLYPLMVDQEGKMFLKSLPPGFVVAGTAGEAAFKAVSRYMQGVTAFSDLASTGFPSISNNVVKLIASYQQAFGPETRMQMIFDDKALTPEEKRALSAWATVVAGKTYKDSGAQVNISEFNRGIANYIPTDGDNNPGKLLKRRVLLRSLQSDKQQAQIAGLLTGQSDLPDIDEIWQQSEQSGTGEVLDPNEQRLLQETP